MNTLAEGDLSRGQKKEKKKEKNRAAFAVSLSLGQILPERVILITRSILVPAGPF